MSGHARRGRGPLCLMLGLLLIAGVATAQDTESFAPADAARPYGATAQVDRGSAPLVTLTNPSHDDPVTVDVAAIDTREDRNRWHTVTLEPGGSSVFGLPGASGFDELHFAGSGPFTAELEDEAAGRRSLPIVQGAAGFGAKAAALCDGTWQLSCISPKSCTYVSPFEPGRVDPIGQVYWNLHTPDGYYRTTNPSSCTTIWYGILANGCPTRAYNCYGQTFKVEHDVVPPPTKDLVIRNLSVTPSTFMSGATVTVAYDITNLGNQTVTEIHREAFYLSTDTTLDPSDAHVWTTGIHSIDIPPGGFRRHLATVPISAAAGSYYLLVDADDQNTVPEVNESNNVSAVPVTVQTAGSAQLTIEGLTYRPSWGEWMVALHECKQGQSCTRSFTIRNTGTASAPIFFTDNSDSQTTVSHNCTGSIAPGATCTFSVTHTLPSGVARRYGGDIEVAGAPVVPNQSDFEICIADDNSLCRL